MESQNQRELKYAAHRPSDHSMTYKTAFFTLLGLLAVALCDCRREKETAANTKLDLSFDPSPPKVGDAEVTLKLDDDQGKPLACSEVKLEGNMNHAGMKPSLATLQEIEPGRYEGTLEFTMGGDWFVLVTCRTADGKRIERKIDVPGVRVP